MGQTDSVVNEMKKPAPMAEFCTSIIKKFGTGACAFTCPYTEACAEFRRKHGGALPCGAII